MDKKEILWLVTARSGSKSITHKNIKLLDDIPLFAYRIKSALAISEHENVWVSTDSTEYAEIAKSFGATVPFIRPEELSTDTASSIDVVLHAMRYSKRLNKKFDAIGLLEPTSPFITSNQLQEALKMLFSDDQSENIVAVRIVRPHTFFVQEQKKYLNILSERFSRNNKVRRQDRKDEITPSGGFYIAKWNSFLKNHTFYTEKTLWSLVPELNGLEIDEPIDWMWAEFLLEKGFISRKELFNDTY